MSLSSHSPSYFPLVPPVPSSHASFPFPDVSFSFFSSTSRTSDSLTEEREKNSRGWGLGWGLVLTLRGEGKWQKRRRGKEGEGQEAGSKVGEWGRELGGRGKEGDGGFRAERASSQLWQQSEGRHRVRTWGVADTWFCKPRDQSAGTLTLTLHLAAVGGRPGSAQTGYSGEAASRVAGRPAGINKGRGAVWQGEGQTRTLKRTHRVVLFETFPFENIYQQ